MKTAIAISQLPDLNQSHANGSSCLHWGHSRTVMGSLPLGLRIFSPIQGFLQAGQLLATGLSQLVKSHLG